MAALFSRFELHPEHLHSVQLTSVFTSALLIAISIALNLHVRRSYFTTWAVGWVSYLGWLIVEMSGASLQFAIGFPIKDWLIATAAVFFGAASMRCRGHGVAAFDLALLLCFLAAWCCVANVFLSDRYLVEVPLFSLMGLSGLWTSLSFLKFRKTRRTVSPMLLVTGFASWGVFLFAFPHLRFDPTLHAAAFLSFSTIQCCLAVGMIILVMEDMRAERGAFTRKLAGAVRNRRMLRSDLARMEGELASLAPRIEAAAEAERKVARMEAEQPGIVVRERADALRKLSRGLAHYFNNRLTPVVALSELSHESGGGELFRSGRHLELIRLSALDVVDVIARFRMFASGDVALLEGRSVSMGDFLDDLLARCRREAEKRPADAHVELAAIGEAVRMSRFVSDDETELARAVLGVVVNAMEAGSNGQAVTIDAVPGPSGRTIDITVGDRGCGMDAATLERCFEPFFTTKPPNAASPGLGLSACESVVKRHRGKIGIRSTPGTGTTVTISLPVAAA